MELRFTEASVDRPPAEVLAEIAAKDEVIIWDAATPGFGIRYRGGNANYLIKFSLGGRQGKMMLGKVGAVRLDAARHEARAAFLMVSQGKDPRVERNREEAKSTIGFLHWSQPFYDWLEMRDRVASYRQSVKTVLESKFAPLHSFGVGAITRSMVAGELRRIEKDDGRDAAGRARGILSKYYNFMIAEGLEVVNPVTGTEARGSIPCDRVPQPWELIAIWKAIEGAAGGNQLEQASHINAILRVLLLTAARLNDIAMLKHKQFNKADRTIEIERGKNGKAFVIPLSTQAFDILVEYGTRKDNTGFMFGRGKNHFRAWTKATKLARERADEAAPRPLEHWTPHDFRRSFQTLGEDMLDIDHHIADACLSHIGSVRQGSKRNYNKAQYLAKRRKALQTWADFIDALVAGKIAAADLEDEEFKFLQAA